MNNLIIGRIWIDTFGEMKVLNLTTGAIAELDFKACGIMSYSRYECSGDIKRPDGTVALKVSGHWNRDLSYTRVGESDSVKLWEVDAWPEPANKYGFPQYTIAMNEMSSAPEYGLLASILDCVPIASRSKTKTRTRRLSRRSSRTAAKPRVRKGKGDTWTPRWFKKAEHADLHELEKDVGTDVWEFNDQYDEKKPTDVPKTFSHVAVPKVEILISISISISIIHTTR